MNSLDLLICFCLFTLVTIVTLIVDVYVPEPYMDEIFHADQMLKYCEGNFTQWNPKISTPPGLYLVTYVALMPLIEMLAAFDPKTVKNICSVEILRLVNSLFISVLYIIAVSLIRKAPGTASHRFQYRPNFAAANAVLFPVFFFTCILYYTDLMSLLSVLLLYLLALNQQHKYAGLVAFWSVLMRQTNIVWVGFCAGLAAFDTVRSFVYQQAKKKDRNINQEQSDWDILRQTQDILRAELKEGLALFGQILSVIFPYILVAIGFVGFIIWNGGVALGERAAHVPVFHLVQFYYFACVTVGFCAPHLVSVGQISWALRFLWRHKLLTLVTMAGMVASVSFCTFDHPYLLSDNRHYTFYIWKRWFERHWSLRFVLVPGYLYALLVMGRSLEKQSIVWRVGFVLCSLLVTVPNRLVEFRYFIIPFVIWRIHLPLTSQSKTKLFVEFILYFLINSVTVWVFLFKPFTWPHETGMQRFMW